MTFKNIASGVFPWINFEKWIAASKDTCTCSSVWYVQSLLLRGCNGLNVCVPPKLMLETYPPNVIFGDGAFKRQLGLDEIMTMGPP